MFSDSSTDSESGIRFKTTTTRHVTDKSTFRSHSPRSTGRYESSHDRQDVRSRNYSRRRHNDDRKSDNKNDKSPISYHKSDSIRSEKYRDFERNRDSNRTRDSDKNRDFERNRDLSKTRDADRSRTLDRTRASDRNRESERNRVAERNRDSSRNRSKDRNRKEDKDKRHRSPANKCRSSSAEKKVDRSERIEIKNGNDNAYSSKSSKSRNNLKNDCFIDNDRITKVSENLKDKQSSKNGRQKEENKDEQTKTNDKSEIDKEKHEKKKKNYVNRNNEENYKEKTNIIDVSDEKDPGNTDDRYLRKTKNLSPELLNYKCKDISEEDSKHRAKKLKRTKHSKKHKKKKLDLSEGELTPSDNDTEIDKSFSSNEKTVCKQEYSYGSFIGPEIPSELRNSVMESEKLIVISDIGQTSSEEDSYGPLPSTSNKLSKAHYELEKRALEIRMDKIRESDVLDEKMRDEWMTELPESKSLHLGLGPRKFRAREGPDMSDRSCWTDTPLIKAKPKIESESQMSKRIADDAHRIQIQQKDIEQEKIVKKLKKKHKRDESLLELHQKKLRKKKKKEKEAGMSTERRRFDRNIDLGVNRFDEAQKKSILKKAQLLDTRFSRGESKYL